MASQTTSSTPQSQPQTTSQQPTSSKPEVTLPPTSHLDPGAYVRSTHPITIGQNVLIHPRVYLLSIHSPLIIGDGCIIGEKSVLGGPAPTPTPTTTSTTERPELTRSLESLHGDKTRPTTIESNTYIHPGVTINHGALIKTSSVLESNSIIGSNAVVGEHCKVAAGLIVTGDVPGWMVLWGRDGDSKWRKRRVRLREMEVLGEVGGGGGDGDYAAEVVDNQRLKAMGRERDGTIAILKMAASRTLTTGGGGGQRKR